MARRLVGLMTLMVCAMPFGSAALAQLPREMAPASIPQPGTPLGDAMADLTVGPPPRQPPPGVPGEYFECDPLLDVAELPPPGFFGSLGVYAVNPHIQLWADLRGPVNRANGKTDIVSVTGAHLDWTASPDVMLGYRLPSGFGAFTIRYQGYGTSGDQTVPVNGLDADVHSRLDMNLADLDYRSEEFSLWPGFDSTWMAGGRFINGYFDSLQNTATPMSDGAVSQHVTNHFYGFGPHGAAEFACFLHGPQWALVGRLDGAWCEGRIRQTFSETTTAGRTFGSAFTSSQNVPILQAEIGIRYRYRPGVEIFFGYRYEHFWNIGRDDSQVPVSTASETGTQGEVYDHAIVLRANFIW
jgi:hypothetical protein